MPRIDNNPTLISDAYSIFVLDMRSRRLAAGTLENYRYILTPLFDWLRAHDIDRLHEITPNHIRGYLVACQDRDLSPTYLHNIARATRAFLNFCVTEELIDESPMKRVRMPRTPKETLPALSDADVAALLRHTRDLRNRAIILLLLDTGLRASELCALNGEDIDTAQGIVRVESGKGEKDRVVHIGNKTAKAIMHYYVRRGQPGKRSPVFPSEKRGARLTRNGLWQMLQRVAQTAGIEHCNPHAFRRTFALNCLRNGMDIYVLARLMGHADISILRHYLALTDRDLAAAHQRYGVVDNL